MYDLIVVGAGPAGSSAARTAAQLGLRTLLLEKERIPRNKLCGGGVTPKVLKLFDFNWPTDIVEYSAQSARIHVGENNFNFKTDHTLVYMTSRTKFDTFLSEKAVDAGAELRDRTRVDGIKPAASHVEVRTTNDSFQSKMVIGADGMGGLVAREGGFYDRWIPDQVAYAIESEVPVGERDVRDFGGAESCFDVYFGVSPAGYGWVFPKDDHLTIGVGCRLSRFRDAQELFNGFARHVPALAGREIPKPQAHLIPLGGAVNVPIVRDRILLAGDSAGFAEPLLGEGIYFSILGAQLAAQTAAEACHSGRFDGGFLRRYQRDCRREFMADFDIAFRMASVSYLEEYDMDRVAKFFFTDSRMRECMVGLMDGSARYRDVQKKLAWPYFKYRLARLGLSFLSSTI